MDGGEDREGIDPLMGRKDELRIGTEKALAKKNRWKGGIKDKNRMHWEEYVE